MHVTTVALVLAVSSSILAQVPLDRRYVDRLNGFSLRPPAGTERQHTPVGSRLVSWVRRDPETEAIAWTLSVLRVVTDKPEIDLDAYAKQLAERLETEDRMEIRLQRVARAAGQPAMRFAGVTRGAIPLYRHQVWMVAPSEDPDDPVVFLILTISGPEDNADRLDAILNQVLTTMQLVDPVKELEAQKRKMQAGRQFLAKLDDQTFAQAMLDKPGWFLLRYKGEDAGFRRVIERRDTQQSQPGYLVQSHALVDLPEQPVRLLRQDMFVTPDLGFEQWKKRLQIGSGAQAQVLDEACIRENDLIVCNRLIDGQPQPKTQKARVPDVTYLPQAVGLMLTRLVNLKQPVAYAFAVYNSDRNSFDMRSFTVEGVERIRYGGREVPVYKAVDRPSLDAEPATLWLDGRGMLLRMETPDGLTMERTTQRAIERRYPKAMAIIHELGDE
jgi:hypothetical protein